MKGSSLIRTGVFLQLEPYESRRSGSRRVNHYAIEPVGKGAGYFAKFGHSSLLCKGKVSGTGCGFA